MSRHSKPAGSEARRSDPRKVSIYLPTTIMDEIEAEAKRQRRTWSNLVQIAWMKAKAKIRAYAPEAGAEDGTVSDTDS